MDRHKPDLTERKRKLFVTDQDGSVRLVESLEDKETFLQENLLTETQSTSVNWRCELCGTFASTFTELRGKKLGFQCGCVRKQVKRILSNNFWRPGLQDEKEVEKAILLKSILAQERRSGLWNSLKNVLGAK